ncbi:MAG: hypothetical protein JST82_01415 [Bacteroidetes bacterium]|nr:hypothetical protein [Bacteroidota bacterium]
MKTIRIAIVFVLTGLAQTTFAQSKNGKENIEKLCGCFSVNFKYAETFSPVDTYKYHPREELNATELALPIESTDTKLVMQHLLVINDTMIIKHWREEWSYELPVLYQYQGNKVWNRRALNASAVKGKWTQTVLEVNDEPRYQGVSAWINNDGQTYWESTADAPLPRREYTTRNDYNILKRKNRIQLTADGYMHEQDNDKIIRSDKADVLLVQEKGYNKYIRMDESECAVAKAWWEKNKAFWTSVRSTWAEYVSHAQTVAVKNKVADKRLDEHITALYNDWKKNKMPQAELEAKLKDVLKQFL